MDTDLIKSLIAALEASSLSELEFSKDGVTLRLVKAGGVLPDATEVPPRAAPVRSPPAPPASDGSAITSPMFGVVHLSRSPGTPPLVERGQMIAAGQVLCLIEAMKVFTELRADRDCTIAELLVRAGDEVQAGQKLFRLS